MLNDAYGTILKVLNKLRVQLSLKKTLLLVDCQGKTINTNIDEVQAKDVAFPSIDKIYFVAWTFTNKFARYWYCGDIHMLSILKQAIEKATKKSPGYLLSSKLFEDESNDNKISLLGLCLHTPREIL